MGLWLVIKLNVDVAIQAFTTTIVVVAHDEAGNILKGWVMSTPSLDPTKLKLLQFFGLSNLPNQRTFKEFLWKVIPRFVWMLF